MFNFEFATNIDILSKFNFFRNFQRVPDVCHKSLGVLVVRMLVLYHIIIGQFGLIYDRHWKEWNCRPLFRCLFQRPRNIRRHCFLLIKYFYSVKENLWIHNLYSCGLFTVKGVFLLKLFLIFLFSICSVKYGD